jgi:phenylalanyl-tRNA synthetase alpha chain
MKEKLESLLNLAKMEISECSDETGMNLIKSKYMGKSSEFASIMKEFGNLSPEEKKSMGVLANEFRNTFTSLFDEKLSCIKSETLNRKLESEKIDITLPSKSLKVGSLHPLTQIRETLEDLFVGMGYDVVEGPQIETDVNCFEKLNIPKDHPARDMQDTFYITDLMLLRSQTSSVQVRTMLANIEKTPIKMVCPGKVYRRDDDDATHSHQFTQMEGLVVDKNISLADLKGTLLELARGLLGKNTNIRFRPSYFGFTEPSYEVDVSCFKCGGKGCSLCKNIGWIEILGSGMVHPNVLRMCGYDPEVYTGFAFGVGLERLAMFKYGITDLRTIYTGDVRFLDNFNRKDVE